MCQLVVPPPSQMLDAERHFSRIPKLEWEAFFNFTLLEDKAPTLLSSQDSTIPDWIEQQSPHFNVTKVKTKSAGDLLLDLARVKSLTDSQQALNLDTGIVWEIRSPFRAFKQELKAHFASKLEKSAQRSALLVSNAMEDQDTLVGCYYMQETTLASLQLIVDQVWTKKLGITTSQPLTPIGFLHIRQGDSTS
jgi:hypothetical protein